MNRSKLSRRAESPTRRNVLGAFFPLGWAAVSPVRARAQGTTVLFADLPRTKISAQGKSLKTAGYSRIGHGAARYVLDPDQGSNQPSRSRSRVADGRWFVLDEEVIDVAMTGAVGDGRADDTVAIQSAMDLGRPVRIPAAEAFFLVRKALVLRTSGQEIFGLGRPSRIVQRGAGANASVFFGQDLKGVVLRDVALSPGTSVEAFVHGFAAHFRSSSQVRVERLTVTGHRRGGIALEACSGGKVLDCLVTASVVRPSIDDHAAAGVDILVLNGGEDIEIVGNRCTGGGAGTGIALQSVDVPERREFNRIQVLRNQVSEQGAYGVMLYRGGPNDTFRDVAVRGNTVSDISGQLRQSEFGQVFGAGIYVQGADGAIVADNIVRRTNTATERELLAPAGIGVANARQVLLEGNIVEDCRWYGICLFDPNNQGRKGGLGTVRRNQIRRSGKEGLYLKDFPDALVEGNTIADNGDHGLLARAVVGSAVSRYKVRGNSISGNRGDGILIMTDGAEVVGNDVRANSGKNIDVRDKATNKVSGNVVGGWIGVGLTLTRVCEPKTATSPPQVLTPKN